MSRNARLLSVCHGHECRLSAHRSRAFPQRWDYHRPLPHRANDRTRNGSDPRHNAQAIRWEVSRIQGVEVALALFHLAHPDAKKSRYLFGLNEYSTQQNAIDLGTAVSPIFKTAYETYLAIHEALMDGHPCVLKRLITEYQPTGSVMDTAIATLRKNLPWIINAAKSPYSNGPIEGVNRKIKELKRTCYGFANQANMFVRVYQLIA
jgi:Transposase and inactivated derivatives